MSKLYEIKDELKEVLALDLPAEELADTLEAVELEFNEKAVNIAHVNANFTADIEALDVEIKRLQARKKAMQNRQESLKDYLRVNMEAAGISKIDCPLFSITLAKPQPVVVVDDESLLGDEFVTVKTTIAADKVAIKKALKAGEAVPGAHLEDGKSSVRIR